jgi:hypothetical protein
MALIRVVVQDERGEEVGEGVDIPSELLLRADEQIGVCLRFVDPYGDTTFNRLQIPVVLEELHVVKEGINDPRGKSMVEQVETLAVTCQTEPHLYLKFIGD